MVLCNEVILQPTRGISAIGKTNAPNKINTWNKVLELWINNFCVQNYDALDTKMI